MLEEFIAKFLTHFLAEFVESIDNSQISMQIWKGNIFLDNLAIKECAFSKFKLPLRVKKGHIKSIRIKLPWKTLSSEAASAEISEIFILAELDEEYMNKHKGCSCIFDSKIFNKSKKETEPAVQSLMNIIINNLRMNIQSVHIRIEIPLKNQVAAFGFVIPHITLYTIDKDKKPILSIQNLDVILKQLLISQISIYLDVPTEQVDISSFSEMMTFLMASKSHQYIIDPISIDTILTHTRNQEESFRNFLETVIQHMVVSLDFNQCRALLELKGYFTNLLKRRSVLSCFKPHSFEDPIPVWCFITRCAKRKNDPLSFKPKLAIAILNNREKVKTVKDLDLIEPDVGVEVTYYLNEYIKLKRLWEYLTESKEINKTFNISEFQAILKSTDDFFTQNSFAFSFSIPSLIFNLQYAKDEQVIVIEYKSIDGNLNSINGGTILNLNCTDYSVNYINKDDKQNIIKADLSSFQHYFVMNFYIPSDEQDPMSLDIEISSNEFIFNLETLQTTFDFITLNELSDKDVHNELSLTNALEYLEHLKNIRMNVVFGGSTFALPYRSDESLIVKMKRSELCKQGNSLAFKIKSQIEEIKIKNTSILNPMTSSISIDFNNDDTSKINVSMNIEEFNFLFEHSILDSIPDILNYYHTFFNQIKKTALVPPAIVIGQKSIELNYAFNVGAITIKIDDYSALITNLNLSGSNVQSALTLESIKLNDQNIDIISLLNANIEIKLVDEMISISMNAKNPVIRLEKDTLSQIIEYNGNLLELYIPSISKLTFCLHVIIENPTLFIPFQDSHYQISLDSFNIVEEKISLDNLKLSFKERPIIQQLSLSTPLKKEEETYVINFDLDNFQISLEPQDVLGIMNLMPQMVGILFIKNPIMRLMPPTRLNLHINDFELMYYESIDLINVTNIALSAMVSPNVLESKITVQKVYGYQKSVGKEMTIIDFSDPLKFNIHITKEMLSLECDFPKGEVSLTPHFTALRIDEILFSQFELKVHFESLTLSLLEDDNKFLSITFKLDIDGKIDQNNMNLDFLLKDLTEVNNCVSCETMKMNVHDANMYCSITPIKIGIGTSTLNKTINQIQRLIPTSNKTERELPPIQLKKIDFVFESFDFKIYPIKNGGTILILCLPRIEYNTDSQNMCSIPYLKVLTQNCNKAPMEAIVIQKIMLFFQLREEVVKEVRMGNRSKRTSKSKSLSTFHSNPNLYFESIKAEEKATKLDLSIRIENINITYSHQFAAAIFECKTLQISKAKIPIRLSIEIPNINLNFFHFSQFASVDFEGLSIQYDKIIKAKIVSISMENLLKCSKPIKIIQNDTNILVICRGFEVIVDFAFFFTFAAFILSSPILAASFTLPFSIELSFSDFHIILPTSIEGDKLPLLHVKGTSSIHLKPKEIAFNTSDISIYFSNPSSNEYYPDLVQKLKYNFSLKNMTEITASLSSFTCAFGVFDLVLFQHLIQTVKSSLSMLTNNIDISPIRFLISSFQFKSEEIVLITCKDNRSSSKYIPIFKFAIPPIDMKLSSSNKVDTMLVEIKPYLQHFNQITGKYDLLLEPMTLRFMAILTEQVLKVQVDSMQASNINLPIDVIHQIKQIWANIHKKHVVQHAELPQFWMENNLGIDAEIKLVNGNTETFFIISNGQAIPVFNLDDNTSIELKVEDKSYKFTPNVIIFPTIFSASISVIKRPYNGGILFQFNSPFQLENKLPLPIDIYQKDGKDFIFWMAIMPNHRIPLCFMTNKPKEFLFTAKQCSETHKHCIVHISPNDSGVQQFDIDGKFSCLKVVQNDQTTGTVVESIMSSMIAKNLMPVPLYICFSTIDEIIEVQMGETQSLLYSDPKSGKFVASFSTDGTNFSEKQTLKISFKDLRTASIFDKTSNECFNVAVHFEMDKQANQVVLSFFVPIVFFNFTQETILIEELGKQKCKFEVSVNQFKPWFPATYLNNNQEMNVNVSTFQSTAQPIDCFAAGASSLFLPIIADQIVFKPIRYIVEIQNQKTAVVTFSTLLTVKNELNCDAALQPISEIPSVFNCHSSLSSMSDVIGEPFALRAGTDVDIVKMSPSGAFLFSMFSFSTTPSLKLTVPQRTVFRMLNKKTSILIELLVQDIGYGYVATFKPMNFPTPIVISNALSIPIEAYQLQASTPFVIEPESTSRFALDEPFSYPSVHLIIEDQNYVISLVEETDPIEINKNLYVEVRQNSNNTQSVIVMEKPTIQEESFKFQFFFNFELIHVSIIDQQMREFALITLNKMKSTIEICDRIAASFSIDSFQLDDQHPLAAYPVVLYGRNTAGNPFVSLECLFKNLTTLSYCNIVCQRMDAMIDISFISDFIRLLDEINYSSIIHLITPMRAQKMKELKKVIQIKWLEVSPIYLVMSIKSGSTRPNALPLLPYFGLIPSFGENQMLIPGVVIAQVTDYLQSIIDRLVSDYKISILNQSFSLLGPGARILRSIGLTGTITSLLGISINSDSFNDTSSFARSTDEKDSSFDNRREIWGCFSQQNIMLLAMKIQKFKFTPSSTIIGLTAGMDSGLKIKSMPNCGFGRGISGTILKTSINTLRDVGIMAGSDRMRVPRAFPNNKIGSYNKEISIAQTTIQKKASFVKKHFEQIRLTTRCLLTNDFICITDNFIFVLLPTLEDIIREVEIIQVKSLMIVNTEIKIEGRRSNETLSFRCPDEETAVKINLFVGSQRFMNLMFSSQLA